MSEIESRGVSRRRVVQGAAWATPAILIASAAPALAQSPAAFGSISATVIAGSHSSKSITYRVTVTATNSSTIDANFYVSMVNGSIDKITGRTLAPGSVFTLQTSPDVRLTSGVALDAPNSYSFDVTIHYQSNDAHGLSTFTLHDNDGASLDSTSA